ncbi:hypothetical protein CHUAL_013178 [Chamberlinius hualienensis]
MLSAVRPFFGFDYSSYSGFITVDLDYESNIFFWFFISKHGPANDPVLMFINGGPGTSAMFGLFGEIGPFFVNSEMNLEKRLYNWVDNYSVIFVDLPVGGGYSFTKNPLGYATTDFAFAQQGVQFLQQFFKLFSEYQNNEFYIVAESYSAKAASIMVPLIHNLTASYSLPVAINLKGLIAISGFIDPKATRFFYKFNQTI